MERNEPTTGEIIHELTALLPPMTNYAESICAEGAFAHSTYMVWDEPEPYIIKRAIDRIEQQEQRIAALETMLSDRNDRYRLVTDKINEKINRIAELERELAAAKAEFEVIRQDGICEVCKFGDNAPPDCREYCCFVWHGAREGEGK